MTEDPARRPRWPRAAFAAIAVATVYAPVGLWTAAGERVVVAAGPYDAAAYDLVTGRRLAAEPLLDEPGGWLVGDLVVAPRGAGAAGAAATWVARLLTGGHEAWRWHVAAGSGRARMLAVETGALHLLTAGMELVTLDAASGRELSRFACTYRRDPVDWVPGHAYASDGFVAVERLRSPGDPEATDDAYYRFPEPMLLVGA